MHDNESEWTEISALRQAPADDLKQRGYIHTPLVEAAFRSAVYGWLTGESTGGEVGVRVTVPELGGLRMWLAVYEPGVGCLVATGDWLERDLVPRLVKLAGNVNLAAADVLVGDAGMAALMRPLGQPAPAIEINEVCVAGAPFSLYARGYGPDDGLALRLVTRIGDWDTAGRPSSERLFVQAYAKASEPMLSEGKVLVDKAWTRLVLGWHPSRSD